VKFTVVARNILLQNIRHKILNVLVVFTLLMVLAGLGLTALSPGAEQRVILDTGLAGLEIFGFLVVVFSMAVLNFEETDMRTIWLVLSKPVGRAGFLLGKFLGLIYTLGLNLLLMSVVLLIIGWIGTVPIDQFFPATVILTFFELVIFIAVAIFFSVISSSVINGLVFSLFAFLIGHMAQYLKLLVKSADPVLRTVVYFFYYLLPNLEYFNVKDAVYMTGIDFSWIYVVKAALYGIIYSSFLMLISTAIFRRREI